MEGFRETDDGVEMLLADTDSIPADMVVLAIGVTPDTHLAQERAWQWVCAAASW